MKDDRFYLLHIRDAIADVRSYAEAGRDAFFGERMRQDGVIRKLEVIGEAVKGLSADTRARFPDIPWRQIAGMRNILVHDYFRINHAIVWETVAKHLPAFKQQVEEILRQLPEE